MPLPSDYISGTITLTNGSVNFTGTGTGWLAADFREGDIILDIAGGGGRVAVVQSITGNDAGTLSKAWDGPTLTGVAYRIRYQWDSSRVSAQTRTMIEKLGNGNLESFSSLTGPGVVVMDGPHSVIVKPESDFINGVAYDVQVDTLPDRAAYDGQSVGFAVLVSDVGTAFGAENNGRSAVFSKASNTSADWTDPAFVTGPPGVQPDIEASVTLLSPGGVPDVIVTPITDGYSFEFQLPASPGFYWESVYNSANAYAKDSVVRRNGSSFIAVQDVPAGTQPSGATPPVDTAFWEVLAAKGNDGAGTVTAINEGAGINIDATDPTIPVVSIDGPTATPLLTVFGGDAGSGGTKGLVPAPATGDAAADKVLKADGTWGDAGADAAVIQSYWMPTNLELAELSPAALLIGMGEGNGVFDGFNSLTWVDVANAVNLNTSVAGTLRPNQTTVTVASNSIAGANPGWLNHCLIVRIEAAQLSNLGSGPLEVVFKASNAEFLGITSAYIGHAAASGDSYDFEAAPTQLFFNGGSGIVITPFGASAVGVAASFTVQSGKALLIAYGVENNADRDGAATGGATGWSSFYKAAAASEAGVVNKTGFSPAGDAIGVQAVRRLPPPGNLSVSSKDLLLPEAPVLGRLVAIVSKQDAILNTDLVFSLSRNGSAYQTLTMAEVFPRADGSVYIDSGLVDISGVTTGTNGRYRIQTSGGKSPIIRAVGALFGADT